MIGTIRVLSLPCRRWISFLACLSFFSSVGPAIGQEIRTVADWNSVKTQVQAKVASQIENLVGFYKYLHMNPEMSFEEEKTAAKLSQELKTLGFEVTGKVGGHGIMSASYATAMAPPFWFGRTWTPFPSPKRQTYLTRAKRGLETKRGKNEPHARLWP